MILFNFGPQHPSTHGVLSLISMLYGEIIQWMTTEIGLLHSGTEKLIDLHYYNSSISYFDRFDYVSTITQELLFVHGLESFMIWYVSIYDSTLRSLFLEFYRILNHSLAITTHAIDIGLFTSMLWSFEESEKLINFSELLSGNSFHATFLLMGSLSYDISARWIESFLYWLMHFTSKLKEINHILSMNRLWISRLYDMGFMESDFCFYFGLSGLLSRSAKIWIDASFLGYECYQYLDYSMFFGSNSDCLDRYLLRFNEMIESCCMIYGLFIVIFDFGYLFNYYSVSSFSMMELLISMFLIIFPFILSLNQLLKLSIESSKGIYSIFLNYFPYFTMYILTNDFLILNQFNKYARCINLGDLIALLGSIDFVLGSMDLYLMLLFILFILLLSMLLILFSVTSIFSIIHFILLSDNFECGFYPRLLSMLKYKFNYWILTIYFLIFEQELILILLLTFSISTFNEYLIILFLLGMLLLELF